MSAGGVEVQQMEETVTYESNTSLEELMLHNSCPIHMLLKCIPQFDQIVQLYFRCKICQQAQVHAGINTFLQHVKDEHGEFFQPQFEVVSDGNNVTMVVVPPPVKAEVVETIVTETQDDYHDSENYTDTYEGTFSNQVESQEVKQSDMDTNEKQQDEVSATQSEIKHEQNLTIEDKQMHSATVVSTTTTSALESPVAPSVANADIIQEEELHGATVIEMSTEEAEQVLIQAGTEVVKHDLMQGGNGTVIQGGEVEIGGTGVEALIANQAIEEVVGNQTIEVQGIGNQAIEGQHQVISGGDISEAQLVEIHTAGNQSLETQVIGNQAVEVQVVTPGSQNEYQQDPQHILAGLSHHPQSVGSSLEIVQGLKAEVYQEEIEATDLQILQEQAQQQQETDDPNSLKHRRCKKCLKTFVNSHSLQRHYKETHLASPNWFVCPVPGCKYMAKRRSDIVGSHLKRRHKNVDISKWKQDPTKVKKVHLPLSEEKLAENQTLIDQCMFKKRKPRVPRMAPDGNIYTCKECDLYFSNMKMLKRHHQSKHADEILWMLCPVDGCNFTCKTKRHLLEIHIPRRHKEENVHYYKENKEIIQKVYLPRGMKYLPEYEEQLYTDNAEYLEEAETIAKKKELANQFPLSEVCDQTEEGYSCKVCQKTYREKKRIRQHYRIFHSDPTVRPRSRRGHLPLESMAVLSDDKTPDEMLILTCKECNREYKSKHSLKRHYIDNHLDEILWYMCPVEGCKYASKRHADLLQSHCERIHKGVDVSDFKRKPGLLKTLSMPPGEHPVNVDGTSLKNRKKSYAIEEIADVYAIGDIASFKCKECGKDFHSRQALRQHFGDSHAELVTWYKCPVGGCYIRCKRRHELLFLHLQKAHPDVDCSQFTENPGLIEFVQLPPEVDTSRIPHQGSFPIEAVADMTVSNEDAGYTCSKCEMVFGLKKELRQHYRDTHMGTEIWFRCPVENCGYMSSRQQEMLETHASIVHRDQDFSPWINDPALLERVQVQLESEDEESEAELRQEVPLPSKRKRGSLPLNIIAEQPSAEEASATKSQYKCASCEKMYTSVISLRRHYEATHSEQIRWYKCPVQGCKYATKRPLDLFSSHCARIHKDEDVSRWKNNRSLLEVILLPPGEEPVTEKEEPISMKQETVPQDSLASSDGECSLKCKYCSKECDSQKSLRQHYDAKHQDEEAVTWFKCPIKGCELIRRRAAEITGQHFTKCHEQIDGSLWKDNPDLLETVKLPQGISRMGEQMINGTQKKSTAPVAKQIVTPSVKEEVSHLVKQEETPSSITSSSEEESSSYPCTKCWKVFQSPVMLRRHDNSVHQSLLATNIKWYKCPVGDCKFITNTVSGILKTHCARVHSDVDVTKWKEEPNLIDTVEMAAGIGSGIKQKEPKSKSGRQPKKRRRTDTEEDWDDSDEDDDDDIMDDQIGTPKTDSNPLRRSGRPLDKTAARLNTYLKNTKQGIAFSECVKDEAMPKRGRGKSTKNNKNQAQTVETSKTLPFRCNECDHNYGDVNSLKNHYDLMHSNKLWYKCPVPGCKVVASLWGEIVGIHWILDHKDKNVAKFSKNPRSFPKVPEDSIVFSADEGIEVIDVKKEPLGI